MNDAERHVRFLLIFLTALALSGVAGADESSGNGRFVSYHDDRLTVDLENIALVDALQEVARATGATVRGTVREAPTVTVKFQDVPLNDALRRLLDDRNFTLVYDGSGQLRTISLYGGPREVAFRPPVASGVPPELRVGLVALFAYRPPLSMDGRLAEVLGSKTASWDAVWKAAVQNEDQAVRGMALGALVHAAESAPDLKAALTNLLMALDDAALAEVARGAAGDRAPEVLSTISSRVQMPEVRMRAIKVLKALNAKH